MSDFTIIEDTEPMTFKKVAEFIDCLPISEMDKYELKSRVSELEQDIHLRAFKQGYGKGNSDGRFYERARVLDECKQLVSRILNYYRDEYHFGVTFNGMCNTIINKFDELKEQK